MITLGIGQMEIDWGKNSSYKDHSALFQLSDIKQIPYYYVDTDTERPIVKMREGVSRKLKNMKSRLDLLGYDIASIRERFMEIVREHEDHSCTVMLSFDTFYNAFKEINVSEANTVKYEVEGFENGYDLGEYVSECILKIPDIKDKLFGEFPNDDFERRSLINDLAIFLENMDPYITLRILAENPANLDLEVQWNFSEAIDCGWANRIDLLKEIDPKSRVLIVTEGSSDSFILKKAIEEISPDISDFFDFVDMKENYPFTGTGSLYNFCMGLCRINIQNNIIVVFDNDTAGVEKYKQAELLKKPSSLLITKLPDHPDFCSMQTVGPQGNTIGNINGKAVAIECFLDFHSLPQNPYIRWTAYNRCEKEYQGELENKDEYVRVFKQANLTNASYNSSKLEYLIEYLLQQWIFRKQ
ncbi:HEPN/Toprim-associated domain-containing protein [Hydrogenoanaerobacterium saccharovorans]|nr:HEPN/Toprim-associated domain-containing protein [Hydrogenoanaerobacterium saccharovorans]